MSNSNIGNTVALAGLTVIVNNVKIKVSAVDNYLFKLQMLYIALCNTKSWHQVPAFNFYGFKKASAAWTLLVDKCFLSSCGPHKMTEFIVVGFFFSSSDFFFNLYEFHKLYRLI